MSKGIGCIYKYDQHNFPYPCLKITFVLPQCSDLSIQTRCNSASDASVDEHALASSISYQINRHHGNTSVNDNDDSHLFETPR